MCRSKHVQQLRNIGIINSTTRSHLVGYFYTICITMHGSMNIKYSSCRQPQTYVKLEDAITVFELLMMSVVSLETCWAIKKHWNNKFCYTVASCWLFLYDLYYDARIHEHHVYVIKNHEFNLLEINTSLFRGSPHYFLDILKGRKFYPACQYLWRHCILPVLCTWRRICIHCLEHSEL